MATARARKSIDNPQSFYLAGRWQGYCALCEFLKRPQQSKRWEVNHVLSRQHCRWFGAPQYSPENALRLCAKAPRACHEQHTSHMMLLPVGCLRDENIAFIARWLGPERAYEYLHRYYEGTDPRVEALIHGGA